MTLMPAVLPAVCTCRVPWNDDGRRMSPSPPTRSVPVLGTPSLPRTKCALGASSRVFLARPSRSGADSSDPPLHAVRPARITAASSGAAARRNSMSTSPARPARPPGCTAADSSAPHGSDAGAGPCLDLRGDLRLVLVREELQRRRQLGQPGLLGGEGAEGVAGGDAVIGPVHDGDLVAGADLARVQDTEVGPAGAVGGEPLDQVRHVPEALEVGARDPGGGHL